MQKESAIILVLSLLLAASIVGGINYWFVSYKARQPTAIAPNYSLPQPLPSAKVQQQRPSRTNTPLKCEKVDGSIFWTNASRCEDADLNNKISYADTLKPGKPRSEKTKTSSRKSARQTTRELAKKPSLRGPGLSPPQGTPIECRFSIGKALEIERDLSVKENPRDSIWYPDYCDWLSEARDRHCEVSTELFYYSHLCRR